MTTHQVPRPWNSRMVISAFLLAAVAGGALAGGPLSLPVVRSEQSSVPSGKGQAVGDDTPFARVLHAQDERAYEAVAEPVAGEWPEERLDEMRQENNLLPELVQIGGSAQCVADGLELTEQGHQSGVLTPKQYSVPLAIEAVAQTDSTNIRLYFGRGMVIFNWECNPSELRLHEPAAGLVQGYADKGQIPEKQWQTIRWEIDADQLRVLVNGEPRLVEKGKFAGVKGHVGVGPAWGSVVKLKSLKVTDSPTSAQRENQGVRPAIQAPLPQPAETPATRPARRIHDTSVE